MKYLSDYMEQKQTDLFNETNAFFAFSEEQLNEGIKEGLFYVSLGGGLYVEKGKEAILNEGLKKIHEEAMQEDLKENGREAIIERGLCNYECYYTREIDDAIDELEPYGITPEEILIEFRKNQNKHDD